MDPYIDPHIWAHIYRFTYMGPYMDPYMGPYIWGGSHIWHHGGHCFAGQQPGIHSEEGHHIWPDL